MFTRNSTTEHVKIYDVGGYVRDSLLGVQSKDRDFVVIAPNLDIMREFIILNGGEIFLETPQYFTMRAKMPTLGAADFVLGRKESGYRDGRHPDEVQVCDTIEEELTRRDFTVNAMAIDCESKQLIDPFAGQADLSAKILRCVGNVQKRMHEDSLRALRALRFAITKGFGFSRELESYLHSWEAADALQRISSNRIRDELFRCFTYDTLATLRKLEIFWRIRNHIFDREIRLVPTIYEK